MKRLVVASTALLLLAGCRSGNEPTYDRAALRQARTAVRARSTWPGFGAPVRVGRPSERKLCEARTYHADPCVVVPTVHRVRKLDIHGEAFVWLEREGGRWRVVDTDYVTPDIELTISGAQPAPPWVSP